MTDPIDLWDTIIEEGVAALDVRPVTGSRGEVMLALQVGARDLHPNVLTAAHAAIEVDKLVAFELAEPYAGAAIQLRRILVQALSAKTPSYELKQATAGLLDRYRIELARVVRRAAGADPCPRLSALASPHAG